MPAPRLKRAEDEPKDRKSREELPSVCESLTGTVEQLCAAMSASGAVVALRDAQGLRCLASAGNAPPVGSQLQADSAFTRECVETGAVVLCEDTESDARIRPPVARSLGLRSAVAVPIEWNGSLIGVIEVFCPQPSGILAADVAALKEIAKVLAPMLSLQSAGSSADLALRSAPDLPSAPVSGSAPAEPSSVPDRAPDRAPALSPHLAPDLVSEAAPNLAADSAVNLVANLASDMTPDLAPDAAPEALVRAKEPEEWSTHQGSITTNWFQPEQALPVGQARYSSPGSTGALPGVSAETPTAQTGLTGAASSNPAHASKTDARRTWIARIASFVILAVALLLSLVGLRSQTSKPFSAANVPSASVGPRRNTNEVGLAKERAQNAARTQGATHSGDASRAGAPLFAVSADSPRAEAQKPGASNPRDLTPAPVQHSESITSSLSTPLHDRAVVGPRDEKPAAPVTAMGNDKAASPGSPARTVEAAKLNAAELPLETANSSVTVPATGITPLIKSAMIPRPDFVLDRTVKGHSGWVTGVAFSSDGERLASGSWDQTVKFWDVPSGNEVGSVGRKGKEVQALAFSRDGRWLAVENSSDNVTLLDAVTEKEIRTLPTDKPLGALGSNWVYSIAFSPDGRFLASGVDNRTIRIWHVSTGATVRDLTGSRRSVMYAAFSPDGRLLATGDDDKDIRIWDVSTGQPLRKLSGHRKVIYAVAFSPDGHWLASASADKSIKLWDVSAGRETHSLIGHGDKVTSVAFSPDGRWLASGSWDKTVKVWDVAAGHVVQTLSAQRHSVYTVAFDSHGRWLAAGSEDGTISLWRLNASRIAGAQVRSQ